MIDFKINSKTIFVNLWTFYKQILSDIQTNRSYVYLMELKTHLWKKEIKFQSTFRDPLILDPTDITTGWIEKSL